MVARDQSEHGCRDTNLRTHRSLLPLALLTHSPRTRSLIRERDRNAPCGLGRSGFVARENRDEGGRPARAKNGQIALSGNPHRRPVLVPSYAYWPRRTSKKKESSTSTNAFDVHVKTLKEIDVGLADCTALFVT